MISSHVRISFEPFESEKYQCKTLQIRLQIGPFPFFPFQLYNVISLRFLLRCFAYPLRLQRFQELRSPSRRPRILRLEDSSESEEEDEEEAKAKTKESEEEKKDEEKKEKIEKEEREKEEKIEKGKEKKRDIEDREREKELSDFKGNPDLGQTQKFEEIKELNNRVETGEKGESQGKVEKEDFLKTQALSFCRFKKKTNDLFF